MFSRLALSKAITKDVMSMAIRPVGSSPVLKAGQGDAPSTLPRPQRLEKSGDVRLGFIPEEWFQFFYPKTGVTGPYVFGVTVGTYLLSKEIYILEHEYYTALSIIAMLIVATKKLGPQIGAALDKNIDEMKNNIDEARAETINDLKKAIEGEKTAQFQAEGQTLLIDAKRENVQMQLEAAYRERLMLAYQTVKKRLDYHVEKENIERRIAQKNLVNWVVQNVLKSITPQQEKDTLTKCVADLNALSARA